VIYPLWDIMKIEATGVSCVKWCSLRSPVWPGGLLAYPFRAIPPGHWLSLQLTHPLSLFANPERSSDRGQARTSRTDSPLTGKALDGYT